VQVGLADDHRAGLAQARDDRRIALRMARRDCRAGRRRRARDIDQILHRDRNAMQRATIPAAGDFLFGAPRLGERAVAHHGNERVELGACLDPPEARFRQLDRR
jgi:hypothetical protein